MSVSYKKVFNNSCIAFWMSVILFLTGGTISCGSNAKSKGWKSDVKVQRHRQFDDKNTDTETADVNGDQVPDVWNVYATIADERNQKKKVLIRKEMDINFDGKVDIWQFFDANGARERDEMDLDLDGKIDEWAYYEGGVVIKKVFDLEFDENPDIWKYFENEVLVRVERDTDHNGKIDYWEFYENGVLNRMGRDTNGDGKPNEYQYRQGTPEQAPKK